MLVDEGLKADWTPLERTHFETSMDPLKTQNNLEPALPFYRDRREKDEKDPSQGLDRVQSQDDEAVEEDVLYFEVPYEGGPAGKHLNTFA